MKKCEVCRIALNDEEYPYILPLSFGMDCIDGKVTLYFHSALEGTKLNLIRRDNRASFEMDCMFISDYNTQIAYVSQDSFLFDISVRENIRMGRPAATDAEVEEVSKKSRCYDFIMDLVAQGALHPGQGAQRLGVVGAGDELARAPGRLHNGQRHVGGEGRRRQPVAEVRARVPQQALARGVVERIGAAELALNG